MWHGGSCGDLSVGTIEPNFLMLGGGWLAKHESGGDLESTG